MIAQSGHPLEQIGAVGDDHAALARRDVFVPWKLKLHDCRASRPAARARWSDGLGGIFDDRQTVPLGDRDRGPCRACRRRDRR